MAGLTRYQMAKQMIAILKRNHISVNTERLRAEIMKNLGSDERTIKGYLEMMKVTGLIEDTIGGWKLHGD